MSRTDHWRLRVGLVGAGRIAQAYVDVLARIPEADLVAVADPVAEARDGVAARTGASAFADPADLAASTGVDLAVVCTPPRTHVDLCRTFVEQGVAVLCEKPFSVRAERARRLISDAERHRVTLTMASKFRYVDDVAKAKQILESGILGDVVLFENVFASRTPMAGRWNADPEVAGGGVLIDNGTHSVDLARFFLGPVAEVSAVEGKRVQGLDVEDTAQMFLRTADGVLGAVDLSWSIDTARDAYLAIYGTRGTIEVGWRGSRYRQVGNDEWVQFGRGYDKLSAMGAQVSNVCRAIRGEERLLITAEDAIASVDVVEAAYRSLAHDHWVPVGPRDLRRVEGLGAGFDVA